MMAQAHRLSHRQECMGYGSRPATFRWRRGHNLKALPVSGRYEMLAFHPDTAIYKASKKETNNGSADR